MLANMESTHWLSSIKTYSVKSFVQMEYLFGQYHKKSTKISHNQLVYQNLYLTKKDILIGKIAVNMHGHNIT